MHDATQHDVAVGASEEYRRRRELIGSAVQDWTPREPILEIEYTARERQLWTSVCRRLYAAHAHHACSDYLEGWEAIGLTTARIPSLRDVDARLDAATGFRLEPVSGWLPDRDYYATLATGRLPVTLHLRDDEDAAADPDLVHNLLGHAVLLGSRRFADLHRLVGEAGVRVGTRAALSLLERVFWFTCETGVLVERGRVVGYGARLLSSPGCMDALRSTTHRPLDFAAMGRGEGEGELLYRADSAGALEDELGSFLLEFDEDTPARLGL